MNLLFKDVLFSLKRHECDMALGATNHWDSRSTERKIAFKYFCVTHEKIKSCLELWLRALFSPPKLDSTQRKCKLIAISIIN